MYWYVSGHAPWSDAYESIIYIGLATMFFRLLFGRKSNLAIAATAFVTTIILMIGTETLLIQPFQNCNQF